MCVVEHAVERNVSDPASSWRGLGLRARAGQEREQVGGGVARSGIAPNRHHAREYSTAIRDASPAMPSCHFLPPGSDSGALALQYISLRCTHGPCSRWSPRTGAWPPAARAPAPLQHREPGPVRRVPVHRDRDLPVEKVAVDHGTAASPPCGAGAGGARGRRGPRASWSATLTLPCAW